MASRGSTDCLTGGLPNEAFTIEHAGGAWRVYYSERLPQRAAGVLERVGRLRGVPAGRALGDGRRQVVLTPANGLSRPAAAI